MRALAQGFGGRQATQAAVEISDVAPIEPNAEVFLAAHEGRVDRRVDQETGEDGAAVTTTHTRPGTTVMYKPTEAHGYVPRTVSVSALRLLIRQGWQERCPECKQQHIDKQGQVSTDPNLCAARDPVAVRICPVCQKRIYDNVRFSEQAEAEDSDPNVIREETYENTTGESRTKASLDLHLWLRHARQAQMMGVPPLPAALRDMVEEAKV
jgi:uncharacterized Zn finger protein (UPF0148 family)